MSDDRTTAIHTRVTGELRERFENWRRQQAEIPPRSEAIRQLIEKALSKAEAKPKSSA
jgi:hypothetical protein